MSLDYYFDLILKTPTVDVKNAEVLINTRAKLSCVITGVIRVDEVRWEKPNSGGVIDHGTDGYEIDKGSFNSETNSHTTVLTVPADKNTADSVYTCVIRNEKDHVEYENYVILDVFSKLIDMSLHVDIDQSPANHTGNGNFPKNTDLETDRNPIFTQNSSL